MLNIDSLLNECSVLKLLRKIEKMNCELFNRLNSEHSALYFIIFTYFLFVPTLEER